MENEGSTLLKQWADGLMDLYPETGPVLVVAGVHAVLRNELLELTGIAPMLSLYGRGPSGKSASIRAIRSLLGDNAKRNNLGLCSLGGDGYLSLDPSGVLVIDDALPLKPSYHVNLRHLFTTPGCPVFLSNTTPPEDIRLRVRSLEVHMQGPMGWHQTQRDAYAAYMRFLDTDFAPAREELRTRLLLGDESAAFEALKGTSWLGIGQRIRVLKSFYNLIASAVVVDIVDPNRFMKALEPMMHYQILDIESKL